MGKKIELKLSPEAEKELEELKKQLKVSDMDSSVRASLALTIQHANEQTRRLAYEFIEEHNLEYYFEVWILQKQKQRENTKNENNN